MLIFIINSWYTEAENIEMIVAGKDYFDVKKGILLIRNVMVL